MKATGAKKKADPKITLKKMGPLGAQSAASVSGKNAVVTNAGGATECNSWTITEIVELLDVTSFDSDGWQNFIEGLEGATGNFACVGTKPTKGRATATFKTKPAGGVSISGDIIINSVETGVEVAGVVTYSADFTFDGEPTIA